MKKNPDGQRPNRNDRKQLVVDLAKHLAIVDERCRDLEKQLARTQEKNKRLKILVSELKRKLREQGE